MRPRTQGVSRTIAFDGSIVMRISSQRWAGTDQRFLAEEDSGLPIVTLVLEETGL